MESNRAVEILRALADGRDPASGNMLPPGSPFQSAEVARALMLAVQGLTTASVERKPRPQMENQGKPWSPEEEQRLEEGFARGLGIDALAAAHKRSRIAVTARLEKLGKIPPSAETERLRSRQSAPVPATF